MNPNDRRRINSNQNSHPVVIASTGRQPIVPQLGTNLNASNVASVPSAPRVTNPLQRQRST